MQADELVGVCSLKKQHILEGRVIKKRKKKHNLNFIYVASGFFLDESLRLSARW